MMRSAAKPVVSKARCEIDVVTLYRLDLTVSALRRLSTNTVDVLTLEGEYLRTLDGFRNLFSCASYRRIRSRLLLPLKGARTPASAFGRAP